MERRHKLQESVYFKFLGGGLKTDEVGIRHVAFPSHDGTVWYIDTNVSFLLEKADSDISIYATSQANIQGIGFYQPAGRPDFSRGVYADAQLDPGYVPTIFEGYNKSEWRFAHADANETAFLTSHTHL